MTVGAPDTFVLKREQGSGIVTGSASAIVETIGASFRFSGSGSALATASAPPTSFAWGQAFSSAFPSLARFTNTTSNPLLLEFDWAYTGSMLVEAFGRSAAAAQNEVRFEFVCPRCVGGPSFGNILRRRDTILIGRNIGLPEGVDSFAFSSGDRFSATLGPGGDLELFAFIFPEAQVRSVIPEPGTWAMLIGGFGVVGSALRRRRAHASSLEVARA